MFSKVRNLINNLPLKNFMEGDLVNNRYVVINKYFQLVTTIFNINSIVRTFRLYNNTQDDEKRRPNQSRGLGQNRIKYNSSSQLFSKLDYMCYSQIVLECVALGFKTSRLMGEEHQCSNSCSLLLTCSLLSLYMISSFFDYSFL